MFKWVFWAGIALLPLFISSHSLQKGQVIKQFFSYSISESLARQPFHWLSTELSCHPARIWVEEPPVFHFFSGLALDLFSSTPFAAFFVSWVAFLVILGSAGLLYPHKTGMLCVGLCPIFLRYSIQHLPDLLATAFLVFGVNQLCKKKRKLANFLFILAVTTKFLNLFAVVPVLIWEFFIRLRSGLREGLFRLVGSIVWMILPFLVWLAILELFKIPNPFGVKNGLENRHSGELGLLLSPVYWRRFITWVGLKGVGIVLFVFSLVRCWKMIKKKNWQSLEGVLFFWSVGIVPYWLLVRQGNFVHDYYTLPFAFPIAVLGIIEILSYETWKNFRYALLLVHCLIGVKNGIDLKPISLISSPVSSRFKNEMRPHFCDHELASQYKMEYN